VSAGPRFGNGMLARGGKKISDCPTCALRSLFPRCFVTKTRARPMRSVCPEYSNVSNRLSVHYHDNDFTLGLTLKHRKRLNSAFLIPGTWQLSSRHGFKFRPMAGSTSRQLSCINNIPSCPRHHLRHSLGKNIKHLNQCDSTTIPDKHAVNCMHIRQLAYSPTRQFRPPTI